MLNLAYITAIVTQGYSYMFDFTDKKHKIILALEAKNSQLGFYVKFKASGSLTDFSPTTAQYLWPRRVD